MEENEKAERVRRLFQPCICQFCNNEAVSMHRVLAALNFHHLPYPFHLDFALLANGQPEWHRLLGPRISPSYRRKHRPKTGKACKVERSEVNSNCSCSVVIKSTAKRDRPRERSRSLDSDRFRCAFREVLTFVTGCTRFVRNLILQREFERQNPSSQISSRSMYCM